MADEKDYGALKPDGHMNTRSLMRVNLNEPHPDTINIHDIAYGIGFKPHYSGQTPYFFSVAQHSVLVAELVYRETNDPIKAIVGLFHDSEEAYIGDMITQIKLMFPGFKELAIKIQKVIFEKYGLPFELLPEIKWADIQILQTEFRIFYRMTPTERESFFKNNPGYERIGPEEAAELFLQKYSHFKKLLALK